MSPFLREKLEISCADTAGRSTGSRRASDVASSPSFLRDRARDLLDREAVARLGADEVGGEHEGNATRRLPPRGDDDRRDARAVRALEHPLVVVGDAVADHVDEHLDVTRLVADANGRRVASGRQLARELIGERAADEQRLVRRRAQLLHQPEDRAHPERQLHRRLNGVPRAWIESSTPIAARFAIIDEPPTLMNGSGMPVIGAMPIVIPTFT